LVLPFHQQDGVAPVGAIAAAAVVVVPVPVLVMDVD
jgi:hypothetical protein